MKISVVAVAGISLVCSTHGLISPRSSHIGITSASFKGEKSQFLLGPHLYAQSKDEEAEKEQMAAQVPQPPKQPPTTPSPPQQPDAKSALDGIDEIAAQAELAIKEAEEALANNSNEIDEARKRVFEAKKQAAQLQEQKKVAARQVEAAVAGVGGFLFGTISGGVLDIFLKANNLDLDIEPIIPPTLLAIAFGAAGATLGQKDGDAGDFARNVFGGPLKKVTNSVTTAVTNKIEETVDDIKATPGRIQSAVNQKVQDTTEEIKQIPITIRDNIEDSVEKTVGEIKQIPIKAKDAATKTVEKARDDITDATARTVEEIKAAPGKVAKETREAIVKTVEEVEDTVEKVVSGTVTGIKKNVDEAISIPVKTMDQISEKISSALPKDVVTPVKTLEKPVATPKTQTAEDIVPRPPELPPPPSLLKDEKPVEARKEQKPAPPVQPKIVPPKPVQMVQPPKAKPPTPPTAEKTKETKKESDGFVFSEVSLKNFVQGVKGPDTEDNSNQLDEAKSKEEATRKARLAKEKDLVESKKRELEEKKAIAATKQREFEEKKALAAAKKRELEEKKAAAEEEKKKQLEEEKREKASQQAAISKKTLAGEKEAKKTVNQAKPSATISLGLFNFGQQAAKKPSAAPKGVPTLSNWRQNRDGSLSGTISDSIQFRNGESVTTSLIDGVPVGNSVAKTVSGSRYYLEGKAVPAKASTQTGKSQKQADWFNVKKEADAKRKEAAEEKRQQAIAAAEARKQATEQRKSEAIAAAEARKQATEQKRAEALAKAEAKRQEAEEKRKAEVEEKTVEKAIGKARPGATISLGFFNFGQKSEEDQAQTGSAAPAKKVSSAPRGVPTLSQWKQNGDGSITGTISGSKAYGEGETITTSAITSNAEGGAVVQTRSGSRYYLEPKASSGGGFFGMGAPAISKPATNDMKSKQNAQQEAAAKRKEATAAAAEEKRRVAEERRQQAIEASVAKRKEAEEKRKASNFAKQSSPQSGGTKSSQTFSLGFLNFGQDAGAPAKVSAAPKGVPMLSKWRKNGDGSISGTISGSPAFREGEFVTTSPVAGNAIDGATVRTSSGSSYYLEPKSAGSSPARPAANTARREAEEKKQQAAEARKQAADARKQAAEVKKQQVTAAAEARKQAAEAKKEQAAAIATARQQAAEEKRQADAAKKEQTAVIAEARKQAAEEKSQQAADAAEARKQVAEAKKQQAADAAEAKKQAAEAKKQQTANAAEARKQAAEAKKQQAIALAEARKQAAEEKRQQAAAAAEARKQATEEKKNALLKAKEATKTVQKAKTGSTISLGGFFGSQSKSDGAPSKAPPAKKVVAKKVSSAPRGVPTLSQWRQNRDGSIAGVISGSNAFREGESITTSPITSDAVDGSVVQTSSGSRYYLAPKGASRPSPQKKAPVPMKKQATRAIKKGKTLPIAPKTKKVEAPRGVPSLVSWKKNNDSSISGFISGSPKFREGDRITTSPITKGNVRAGEVVKTGSGSSYFLV